MIKTTLKKALLIALAIIPMTIFAQEKANPTNYWFIGIEGGGTLLYGDNKPWDFGQLSWNAGVDLGYVMKSTIYIYGTGGVVRLKGAYKDYFEVTESKAIQFNVNLGLDVLQLFSPNPGRKFALVPHLGWGIINHSTTAKMADGTEIMTGYQEHLPGGGIGGRRNVAQIPAGINFIFNFTKHFRAHIDLATNYTATNYLDGVNSGKRDDWWNYANIGIAYKFHNREVPPCPVCEDCSEAGKPADCETCADAIKQAVKDAMEEDRAEQAAAAEAEAEAAEAAEAVVWEDKDVHVQFKVGKADVLKTQANDEEAMKVTDDIDAGREVSNIRTVGYASPEGDDEQNQKLSEDRATATSEFIKEKLGDKAEGIEFESEGMGSDWDGFYKALDASNISAKDKIKKEIKNSETPTETLNQLRVQYPELNDILDTLRRTQVLVK